MQAPKLCLVEDDPIMGESLTHRFALEGIGVDWYRDAESALAGIGEHPYRAVISDIRLPDMSGEELFGRLLAGDAPPPPTLFITGYGTVEQAVRLLHLGARDYLTKPFDLDQLLNKLRTMAPELFTGEAEETAEPALGVSPAMRRIQETLQQLAGHRVSVLITGESGVGKEYVANYLHQCESRGREQPFVAVNCAALPENLLEAELFGYEKGAFTGALRQHRGVFEQAHGGTLFLDEIGEMPATMQAKLLRVIQDGRVKRIGSERTIRVELRLVCATNRDLKRAVRNGEFREDLFFRINVIHIEIPPLRERKEDILWFAQRFVERCSRRHGVRRYLLPVSERYLCQQPWPGNVRELDHTIERACILARQEILGPRELGAVEGRQAVEGGDLKSHLVEYERQLIVEALKRHQWRILETAGRLGISRKSLWEKMRRYGIQGPGEE
ncbi:MAG TPA: sigma-54-dependent Fis family transcriptional regulator [Sedimenticola sp.]|nr:sigma-54-dependent Fis family transcriptional regulator [Sedimenticola sp.]